MGEEENVELLRQGFAAFNRGDVATLSGMIAPDAVQHMPGTNKYSGDHVGRDAILGMYGRIAQDTDGTFRAALADLQADGPDRVVATYRAQGQRGAKTLDLEQVLTFEVRDGVIVDAVDTTNDEATLDDFWA
jgi:ketosteroid isomerase-like protein